LARARVVLVELGSPPFASDQSLRIEDAEIYC
jgi:hypothetical protein